MKILIVEPDKSIQSTLETVLLKNNTDHDLTFVNDINEAKPILSEGQTDFVILTVTSANLSEINKQLKSISKKIILTKSLFLNTDSLIADLPEFEILKNFFKAVDYVVKPLSVIRLSSTLMDLITDYSGMNEVEVVFLPIKIDLLKNAVSVPCDLYVKLTEKKYVKIINKDQADTVIDTVERYHKKGIEVLYVEQPYYSSLSHLIVNDFFCAEPDALKQAERGIKITESIMMVTKDLGASEVVLESINESYTEVIKNLENEKLSGLLSSLTKGENFFIENHSYLTSVFAVMMSRKMDWGTTKIQNNICMAALLHDLVLAENFLGQYDKDDLGTLKLLAKKEQDIVINHPKILADKLSKTTKVPSDVISLISKHHEGRGKDSYPAVEGGAPLSPVNCLFNVAHQFAIELYKIGFNNMKLDIAFANLRTCFQAPNMKAYIDLLEKLVRT